MEPLFIETICCRDGRIEAAEWHERRIRETLREQFGKEPFAFSCSDLYVPHRMRQGKVKCRIVYGETIRQVDFALYEPQKVESLRLVTAPDDLDYHLKYADRQALNDLVSHKGTCDQVLLLQHGMITDTGYTNVVLFDGQNWVTPHTTLLNGTRRRRLLAEHRIVERRITPDDLGAYQRLYLINALIGLEDEMWLPIRQIHL